jgi:hypothetical protein
MAREYPSPSTRPELSADPDVTRSAAIVQAAGCSLILNPSTPSA